MKVIVLTGGGTSGHVTPNIALIPKLMESGYTIHYIGSYNGIERQLVEKEGIPYHAINAGKMRRYFDMDNFTDIFRVIKGFAQSFSLLTKLKPYMVFSKGGFVSCPVVWAAWIRRVPVVIHESDITPGLTNRLSAPFAKNICFTFPETAKYLPEGKSVMTGIPIRETLLQGDAGTGKKICGFTDSKPVLMVTGGSQGSENINRLIRRTLKVLLIDFQVCHICGKGNMDSGFSGIKGYKQFEYVNEELPHLFALADIVVSRAGATTLFEILSLAKPNLLIPLSLKASRGDQIQNAESFKRQGFSMVLPEENLSGKAFAGAVLKLYNEREKYISAMKTGCAFNAVDKVMEVIEGKR